MAPQLDTELAGLAMNEPYEYVIVGAGPAGLQMAYFLQKEGRRYVVYEAQPRAATFFEKLPRNKRLLSLNKKYNFFEEAEFNLRHDWNSLLSDDGEMKFTSYSDELYPNSGDLAQYLNDFAEKFQLNICYNTKVTKVSKPAECFLLTARTDGGVETNCSARCVLMATGAMEENVPESIEGLELASTYGQYDMNKEQYKNKMVLVVGGGNSAFETANYLSDTAAIVHVAFNKRIQFAWNTHAVGDLRAVNNNIIEMYHLKSLHSTIGSKVHKIVKNEQGKFVVTFKDLNTHWDVPGWLLFDMEYDQVITCMGWKYVRPEMFDDTIKIETVRDGRYPKLSNCWETDTENLFYIGTTMASIDKQSASGFIHGFRYNIRTLFNLLEQRFFNKPFPHFVMGCKNLQAIADKVIERSTVADSIYQMNGFLCDVMTIDDKSCIRYFTDLPVKHVMEIPEFRAAQHVFIIYLAYGFDKFGETAKPVDNVHAPDFSSNRCGSFMHPHIEYHSYGEYVDQTELMESLIVRYDDWSNAKFPQWTSATNENYVKYFVNDKMGWTKEVFNLTPLPEEVIGQVFVPLNEEERSRLPPLWEKSECKPSQELLSKTQQPQKIRNLRPTEEEVLNSSSSQASASSQVCSAPSSPTLPLQTKRLGTHLDITSQVTTRQ
ncbi:FAD-dependent oxidoreductase domain-containing protein 2-like [Watersipora subatra]|uniref:FAD-dependent oxidoreductase domain-containing protein 2-like n=1 Tax=Watersipora subatra TaxID=2589382 RepID=UPI00355B1F0B